MSRDRRQRPWMLPALGLVVVAAAAALVYLSFLANDGIPFTPARHLTVDVPNAERLAKNDPVRIGGVRVGRVASVRATLGGAAAPFARVALRLDDGVRVPVDSIVRIRQASVLGSSYVEIVPGTRDAAVPEHGRLDLGHARSTVQLTDLLDIFDRSTARGIRSGLRDVSAGLAGRGTQLNATLAALPSALGDLARVSRLLVAPGTRLPSFLEAFERFAAALEPVSEPLAGIADGGAQTFGALARERVALGDTITAAGPTERAVTDAFDRLTPALGSLAGTMHELRRAAPGVRPALAAADTALSAGVRPLDALPRTADRLRVALVALGTLARRPSTAGALRRGADALTALGTTLDVVTPAQVYCNAVSLWAENFASGFGGLGFGDGPAMASVFITHFGAKNESFQNAAPSPDVAINNLPHETAQECEAGNEPYTGKQVLGNPPGLQPRPTRVARPPAGVRERAAAAGLLGEGTR